MPSRRAAFFGLLLLSLMLCRCADDPVRTTGEAQLHVMLLLADQTPPAVSIDTLEVAAQSAGQVWADRFIAADTLFADSSRAIAVDLDLAEAGVCSVLACAYRRSASLAADTTTLAVAYLGLAESVAVYAGSPGQHAIALERIDPDITRIEGTLGYPEITLHWDPVAHATTYDLGWIYVDGDSVGQVTAIAGNSYTLDWTAAAIQDSVLFRLRPSFGSREGIWGSPIGVRPGEWMDLPHLISISPGYGDLVELDTLTVKLGFDRAMDLQTIYDGVSWQHIGGTAIPFTATALFAGQLTHFKLTADPGSLARSQTYRVTISPQVKDAHGLPFDAHTTMPGTQSALIEWHTIAYSPLRLVFTDPPPNKTDLSITPTLRLIMNRAVDAASFSDTSCYVMAGAVRMPGLHAVSPSGDTLTWQPAVPLTYATLHTLYLTPWLRDAIGRRFDGDFHTEPPELEVHTQTFTTRAAPLPPAVESIEPIQGAAGVARDAQIHVFFNKALAIETVILGETFKVLRAGVDPVPGTLAHDEPQRFFTFTPDSLLDLATSYRVEISGVHDLEGNVFDQSAATPGYQSFTADFFTTTNGAARSPGRRSPRPRPRHPDPRPFSP